MSRKTSFEGPPRADRAWTTAPRSLGVALPVITYGMTIGILAVGAGALVDPPNSLLVTVTVVLIAMFGGDPVLRWLLPLPPRRYGRTRPRRHP
jgi:hypothetical protein